MQLLVSVRDAGEAREAMSAGADILDAKEPALGTLAPVSPAALASIAAVLAPGTQLSASTGPTMSRTVILSKMNAAIFMARAPLPECAAEC